MEDIFAWALLKEIHHPHKQHSVNTTSETLRVRCGAEKSFVALDVAHKC